MSKLKRVATATKFEKVLKFFNGMLCQKGSLDQVEYDGITADECVEIIMANDQVTGWEDRDDNKN